MSVQARADGTALFNPTITSCRAALFLVLSHNPHRSENSFTLPVPETQGNSFTFLNAGQPHRPTFLQRSNPARLSQNIFVLQSPQSQEARLHSTVSAARISVRQKRFFSQKQKGRTREIALRCPVSPAFLSTCPASLKAKAFLAPHLNEPFARSNPDRPAFSRRPALHAASAKAKKGGLPP